VGKIIETDFVYERGHNFEKVVKRRIMRRQDEGYDVELAAPSTVPAQAGHTYYTILVISRDKEKD